MKAIVSTSAATSTRPIAASPSSRLSAPTGIPARWRTATIAAPHAGDCSAGLNTTAFPVARAAAVIPVGMATGKFHGAITAATPRAA